MKYKHRILLGFGVIILIFTGMIVNNLVFLSSNSQKIQTIVENKFITEKTIQDSYQIILLIHANIWDTMLFKLESRQNAIDELNGQAKSFYSNVRELSSHIPKEEVSLRKLSDVFRSYYVFGSTILELRNLGEFKQNIDTVNKFKENKQELTSLLDKTVSTSKREFEQSLLELNKSFKMTVVITAVLTGLVILLTLFVALFLAGKLTKPIEYLTLIAQKVTKGDYSVRADIKTHGEVLLLAEAFNSMLSEIEKYNTHMEELVKVRTEELRKSHEQLSTASEIMKRELSVARTIQEAIIPRKFPAYGNVWVSGNFLPMEEVGGDFYDVFEINEDKLGIMIADVAGHGVPAALVTAMAKISFTTHTSDGKSASDIVNQVNRELCNIIGGLVMYLTVFYCILNKKTGTLEYCNAGHEPPFILRNKNEIVELPPNNTVVGYKADVEYKSIEIKIKKGDKLILFTDGIPEARNEILEFYGIDRFKDILFTNNKLSSYDMVQTVFKDISLFIGNNPPRDDITLLVADYMQEPVEIKGDIENVKLSINNPEGSLVAEKYLKAVSLYTNGDYQEIFKILSGMEDGFEDEEFGKEIYHLYALSHYQLGHLDEAAQYWNKVLSIKPNDSVAFNNIAYLKLNRDKNNTAG